jgi:hypothetical protein
LPHQKRKCQEKKRQWFIRRGRERLNTQWPGYGDLLTDEALLARAGKDFPHVAGYPLPSRLFGLDPSLDQRLIRDHRDKNVMLCQTIAVVPTEDQVEFLELYLVDPADAQHWASLPRWKRPIRRKDPDDVLVWKFFIMQRLNMEQAAAEAHPWSMASQGAQLPQMFGMVARMSPAGVKKLVAVMSAFGEALQHGRPLGNVIKAPWDEKP